MLGNYSKTKNANQKTGKFMVTLNDLMDDMAYENNYFSDMYQERGEIYDKEKEKWNLKRGDGGRYTQKFIHNVMKCQWAERFKLANLIANEKDEKQEQSKRDDNKSEFHVSEGEIFENKNIKPKNNFIKNNSNEELDIDEENEDIKKNNIIEKIDDEENQKTLNEKSNIESINYIDDEEIRSIDKNTPTIKKSKIIGD